VAASDTAAAFTLLAATEEVAAAATEVGVELLAAFVFLAAFVVPFFFAALAVAFFLPLRASRIGRLSMIDLSINCG
jgi:hypothetical protein